MRAFFAAFREEIAPFLCVKKGAIDPDYELTYGLERLLV